MGRELWAAQVEEIVVPPDAMSDRLFDEIADPADRRLALLNSADAAIAHLLAEIKTPVPAALEHPSMYDVRVELAIHLRRQIVVTGQSDWARKLDELNYATRALWAASEIAQHPRRSDLDRRP